MNQGWVKLWRKLEDSPIFQNEGLLKVFIWCLLKATHKEIWMSIRTGRGFTEVKILPGSFVFGRHQAAKKLKMQPSTVWKRILKLEKLEILNIQRNTHFSIIVVVNWDTYQAGTEKRNNQENNQGTTKEHKQEYKECKDNINMSIFDLFYKAYPKKQAKQNALRAWIKLNPDKELINVILSALERQKAYKAHLEKQNPKPFISEWPLPATWLNGRRWEDEIPEVKQNLWG
jgi:hypothetical protein